MAEITAVASGNVSDAGNWLPAQIPTAFDTVIFGAYSMIVPGGYTWNPGAMEMTGTSDLARASLTVQSGGRINQAGVVTCNAFNHIRIEGVGIWDMVGNDVLLTANSGADVNNIFEVAGTDKSNHARVIDSVGGAHWGAAAGAAARGKADWQHFTFKNMSFGFGGNWYAGHPVHVRDGVFKDLYEWTLGSGYSNGAEEFRFNYVDVVGSNSASSQIGMIDAQKGNGTGGLHQTIGVTIDPQRHGMSIRIEYLDCERVGWITKDLLIGSVIQSNHYLTDSFFYLGPDATWTTVGGGHYGLKDTVAYIAVNNPHTTEDFNSVTGSFIDAPYAAPVINDGADHCILPADEDFELVDTIIVDRLGGVALNALGSPHSGNYSANHNTIIVDIPDGTGRVYGTLARTETGGSYAGSLALHNNLCVVRSNPNNYDDIRALNFDTAGDDQITSMGNNGWVGYGSLVSDRFFGVTSAGKTIGELGFGGGDLMNVLPGFVDINRDVASWQASQNGGGGAAEAIDSALLVNGYNAATDDQSGTPSGFIASSVIDYVRAGLTPTNVVYDGSADDEGTIGAVPYLSADAIAPIFSAPLSVSGELNSSFDINFTLNENAVAFAIVTSPVASQPGDAAFDASGDTVSVIADTPASISIEGQAAGAVYTAWVQAIDSADNRSVDFENVYLPRVGYTAVVIDAPDAVAENRITASPDVAAGVVVEWGNYINCSVVTVYDDATFEITVIDVGLDASFDVRVVDVDAGDVSADVVQTKLAELDTVLPVISLLGDNPLTLEVGSLFSEPGFTATDNYDGDVAGGVVVTGSIDSNTVGSYTLNYNVDDAAGNSAVQVSRTVDVVSVELPVITLMGAGLINLYIGMEYSEPGYLATDDAGADISGSVAVTGSVDWNTVGSYALNYNVVDAAGNAAVQMSRAVNVLAVEDEHPIDARIYMLPAADDGEVTTVYEGNTNYVVVKDIVSLPVERDSVVQQIRAGIYRDDIPVYGPFDLKETVDGWVLAVASSLQINVGESLLLNLRIETEDGGRGEWDIELQVVAREQ